MTTDEQAFLDHLTALRAQAAQIEALRAALQSLYGSFAVTPYVGGGTLQGNLAKHDVIMHNQDVKDALNTARRVLEATK